MSRSDGIGNPNTLALAQEYNRAFLRAQQRFFPLVEQTELLDRFQIRNHDRKRLVLAMFPLAKPSHAIFIESIGSEMIATEPFRCHDCALLQQARRMRYRIVIGNLTPA